MKRDLILLIICTILVLGYCSMYAQAAEISYGDFTVTAYCTCRKCCGKWSPEVTGKESRTKSGTCPKAGRTVAVDPEYIPLGTVLMINGQKYVAEDTGSAVIGRHIDIYMDTHEAARIWGRQIREVFILEKDL